MTERKRVWVVWSCYHDSDSVVAMRVFEDEQRAGEEAELWDSFSSMKIQLRECEIWG